jgi:hypothetical protein
MGCVTDKNQATWYIPNRPSSDFVKFQKQTNGYYVSENDAVKLANNIDEMKAYEKKMELLVEAMAKFYNAKLEERRIE